MLSNIGFTEILLIAVVVLLLFGPKKLPEIGRALGKTVQEFKKGMKGVVDEESNEPVADKPSPSSNTTRPSPSNKATNNLPE